MKSKRVSNSQLVHRTLISIVAIMVTTPALGGGPYPAISGISAAADDASVAGMNPAAMTLFDEHAMKFEILGFFSDSTFEGELGETGQSFNSDSDGTTIVPTVSMVHPLRDNLWFGWTFLGSGFSEDYKDGWAGRYFIEEYELLYVSLFPSLAMKVNEKFSLAASLALTYTTYEQIKAVPNIDPGYDDGKLTADADGWSAGWALSGLYEFSDNTRAGLSYRSKIEPDLDGKAKFSGLGPITETILDAAGLLNANLNINSAQPQSVVAGMYHEFEDTSALTLDGAWIDFSNFKLSEIFVNGDQIVDAETDYDDIFALSASYSRQVADRWRVGIGGFITNDMVEDENRSIMLRLDRIWSLGAGFEWQWKEGREVSATLNYLKIDDAPVTTDPVGEIGVVSGRFTKRDTVYLRIAIALGS